MEEKKEGKKVTLADVHEIYKKWLYIPDTNRIDVVLATALTRMRKGTKVWLILIGPSGDWKSEQLRALIDEGDKVEMILEFTSRTLVTGQPMMPDLAPALDNKIMLIPDMAQLLTLAPDEKRKVWGQLRNLYDGYAFKRTGSGKVAKYEGLNVTLIAGSTPTIDNQILIHQDLGSRELLWRTYLFEDSEDDMERKRRVWHNDSHEEAMRSDLKWVTQDFLDQCEKDYKDFEVSEDMMNVIMSLTQYLKLMRAPAQVDHFTGDLINIIYPEKESRVLKQFKRMYIALKNLDPNYDDDKAIEILTHLVESSSFHLRVKILRFLIDMKAGVTTTLTQVADFLKIGNKTAKTELNVLWNLGILKRETKEIDKFGRMVEVNYWQVNRHHDIVKQLFASKIKDEEDNNNDEITT